MRKLYSLLTVLVMTVTSVWADYNPCKTLTISGINDESVTVAHDENNIATVVVERNENGTIKKMTVSMPEQYQMEAVRFYCGSNPTCYTNNGYIRAYADHIDVNNLAIGVPSMSLFIDQAGSFSSIEVTYWERDVKDGVADFDLNVAKKFYIEGVVSALFDLNTHVVDQYNKLKISVAQGYAITGVSFVYEGMITASAGTFDENGLLSNIPENTTEITIGSLDFAHIEGMQVYYDKVAESESEGSTATISDFDDGKFVYSDDPVVVYVVSGDYLTDYNNGYYADVNVYGDYYITGIECDVYDNDYMAGGDYGNPDYSYYDYYWSPVVRYAGVTASLGFVSTDDNKTYKITDIPEGAASVRITAEENREFYVSQIRVSYAKKQVSESTPTAVGKIGAMQQDKVVKTIENGKVVIIRNGEKFDLSGVRQ